MALSIQQILQEPIANTCKKCTVWLREFLKSFEVKNKYTLNVKGSYQWLICVISRVLNISTLILNKY